VSLPWSTLACRVQCPKDKTKGHRGEHQPYQRDLHDMPDSCNKAPWRFLARVEMGGTGLEPVTSSLSTSDSDSVASAERNGVKSQPLFRHCAPITVPGLQTKRPAMQAFCSGRYWARTSDPQLVELVLSQLS
jgi:hypothetical protein